MAGDPSQMFGNLPQMDAGPMSGYMRGVGANYGMSQQDASLKTQDLANQMKQLELEQATKGVPLQDAQRGVAMGQAGLDQGDMDSGKQRELQTSAKDAAIYTNVSKMSDAQLHKLNNAFDFFNMADIEMSKVKDPARLQERWEQVREAGIAAGIDSKKLPDYWSPATGAMVHGRAAASESIQKFTNAAALQKAKLESEEKIATGHDVAHVLGSQASAGNSLEKTVANMDADKAIEYTIRSKMNAKPPIPLDKSDLDKASEVAWDKIRKDPEWATTQKQAASRWTQENEDGKKKLNKAVGIGPDADADDYARAKIKTLQKDRVNEILKSRYGDAEVRIGNSIHTVNEVIDHPEGSRAKVKVPEPKGPPQASAPVETKGDNITIKSQAEYNALPPGATFTWKGKTVTKGGTPPPAPIAPPMAPMPDTSLGISP